MSTPSSWHDELQILCEAVVEDRLSAEQLARLEQLVLEHPEARRFYVEYLHQHGCLHWSAADPALASPEPRVESREPEEADGSRLSTLSSRLLPGRSRWRRGPFIVRLLAASVMLGVGIWIAQRLAARAPLATLASCKGCKWDAGSLPTETGARLSAGRLRLAEGIARIVFDQGAEVTLEAPADLELVSRDRCVLHGGRLVAHVPPPAIGFIVDTPTAVLKDLGTEFGVNVKDAQTAEVQVFNGIVDVQHRTSGQMERLQTGRNRRFGTDEVADFDPLAEKPLGATPDPLPGGARVVQISTAMGRGKDAYVQPLFPSPHSSDILLLIKNSVPTSFNYFRKAYIGMDLAPIAGMKVIDAQLSFTFTATGMGFASEVPDATFVVYGLTDESLDSWDERTVRWSNAPANAPGGAELDVSNVVRLGTFEIAQGVLQGTRSVNGAALVDFLNRDTNSLATFILVRETKGSGRNDLVHGFANKRHPNLPPPTLKLTVAPRS
jgi:ferric-dicitrate binding protein FerR (iron transport regulator)